MVVDFNGVATAAVSGAGCHGSYGRCGRANCEGRQPSEVGLAREGAALSETMWQNGLHSFVNVKVSIFTDVTMR